MNDRFGTGFDRDGFAVARQLFSRREAGRYRGHFMARICDRLLAVLGRPPFAVQTMCYFKPPACCRPRCSAASRPPWRSAGAPRVAVWHGS